MPTRSRSQRSPRCQCHQGSLLAPASCTTHRPVPVATAGTSSSPPSSPPPSPSTIPRRSGAGGAKGPIGSAPTRPSNGRCRRQAELHDLTGRSSRRAALDEVDGGGPTAGSNATPRSPFPSRRSRHRRGHHHSPGRRRPARTQPKVDRAPRPRPEPYPHRVLPGDISFLGLPDTVTRPKPILPNAAMSDHQSHHPDRHDTYGRLMRDLAPTTSFPFACSERQGGRLGREGASARVTSSRPGGVSSRPASPPSSRHQTRHPLRS